MSSGKSNLTRVSPNKQPGNFKLRLITDNLCISFQFLMKDELYTLTNDCNMSDRIVGLCVSCILTFLHDIISKVQAEDFQQNSKFIRMMFVLLFVLERGTSGKILSALKSGHQSRTHWYRERI